MMPDCRVGYSHVMGMTVLIKPTYTCNGQDEGAEPLAFLILLFVIVEIRPSETNVYKLVTNINKLAIDVYMTVTDFA